MDKLIKRRETNRRSQQRSREAKEALISRLQAENSSLKRLQAENERLRTSISKSHNATAKTGSESLASDTPTSWTSRSEHALRPDFRPQTAQTANFEAARQAFVAVLASVCEPHLNTIHDVCRKFIETRDAKLSGPDLHPPKPPDWSLRSWCDFDRLTPDEQFVPGRDAVCGPLSVPFLEPAHPLIGLELDVHGIWLHILTSIDLSAVDVQELATRVTPTVRCYGYGPVVLKSDLIQLCSG